MSMNSPGDGPPGPDDRRGAPRIEAHAVRALIVEVEDEGIMVPGALIPHDLSLGGVRGKWERPLPPGDFALNLEVGADLVEARARVAWQRPLPGGGALAGVSFVELDAATRDVLAHYLEALQTPSRRRSPRFPDILPVEVVTVDDSITAIASDVSAEGLQITTDAALPASDSMLLLLPLTWDVPLEIAAVVRWRRETSHGGQLAGLEFESMSDAARAALQAYLRDLDE